MVPSKTIHVYGHDWPKEINQLTLELNCYRMGVTEAEGGLGKAGHFKQVTELLWGLTNTLKQFLWHPWATRFLEAACEHKYLAVSGCTNLGKSEFSAVYAIVNWLCDPVNTIVIVTSTDLDGARKRVWGKIEEYFNAVPGLPGKLVSSIGAIRLDDKTGEIKGTGLSGIYLVASEKKREKDAVGKLIGIHRDRVILIADELPELTPALLTVSYSNLASNPFFQLIGIGNPNSIFDSHGIFSTPKNGWASVSTADDEWETEHGFHIRFDATKSPNITAGKVLYPWLPTQKKIDEAAKDNGEDSVAFWRMWRAFWCPHGSEETVVSEADIVKFNCLETTVKWKTGQPPVTVAFLDPAYTVGGDRSCVISAELGETDEGKVVLLFKDIEVLHEDVTKKDESRNFQIARKFKEFCEKRNITPDRAALDESGGAGFADIVAEVWSRQVTRINFGGKASERPVSAVDKKKACDVYANRVTELWACIREFIRGGQIKGITPDLARELISRKMKQVKGAVSLKSQVESKVDMRARTGKSPDIGDAAAGVIDFVRTKYRFRASGKGNINTTERKNWRDFRMKMGRLSETVSLDRAA